MSEKNCWEVKNCPQATREKCLAFPDYGRDRWQVMGKKEICFLTAVFRKKSPEAKHEKEARAVSTGCRRIHSRDCSPTKQDYGTKTTSILTAEEARLLFLRNPSDLPLAHLRLQITGTVRFPWHLSRSGEFMNLTTMTRLRHSHILAGNGFSGSLDIRRSCPRRSFMKRAVEPGKEELDLFPLNSRGFPLDNRRVRLGHRRDNASNDPCPHWCD